MDFKVTDTTTYQDLINAVHEANALGEGLTLLNGNGFESFTQAALEAMVSDENIMDSFLINNYRHLLPDGHRLKITEEDLEIIKEKLGWGDDEGSFDADYAELPQDIADRAVELEEELKSLLEKGDVKGFIERFDDAVTELSDMSNDDDTSFWRNTLERRMDSLLEIQLNNRV
jgi:hypothetical protein